MLSRITLNKATAEGVSFKKENLYVFGFAIIYVIAFAVLVVVYDFPLKDLLINFLSFGLGLSVAAWLLIKNFEAPNVRPVFKNELVVLSILIIWIVAYITYGSNLTNALLPQNLQANTQWQFWIVIIRKLFVFVLVPYMVYHFLGFSLKDFGLPSSSTRIFSSASVRVFVVMSVIILVFEYFLSGGAEPLRSGQFTASQLLVALPLTFIWMFVEAGVVEEFFFRAILQTRLAALLKSEWAAILIGGLLFALAHVPGLYLRGAQSEGVTEQMPLTFWLSYCIINMSVAGIFLGIIWSRTKNLFLVMALHAVTDLLPNTAPLIHTWHL